MIQNIKYKKDENFIELTGVIKNMPDYCKYIPRPLVSFDLTSQRRRRNEREEIKYDENRIIIFDDEEFLENFKDGDRIKIKGELQSRNYTRDTHEVDELIKIAVKNYIELFDEFPTEKEPKPRIKQVISWPKLLQMGMIPTVPEDSMYLEDGSKNKSKEAPFVYRVDENGEVYKETQHVTYEVVAKKYEKIEEEVDPLIGDKNKAILVGKVTQQPYFDYLGTENKVSFCSFKVCTKSSFFEERVFYNNIISWSNIAEEAFENINADEYVKVVGRLQSRIHQKELIRRWKTPSGKRKKKVLEIELVTREISASKLFKCEKED